MYRYIEITILDTTSICRTKHVLTLLRTKDELRAKGTSNYRVMVT